MEEKLKQIQRIYAENVELKLKNFKFNEDLVDISVIIQVPRKKIHIENFLINPTMTMSDLMEFLMSYFNKLNDPIQEFNPSLNYLIIIPWNLEKEVPLLLAKNDIFKEISKYPEIPFHKFDEDFILRSVIKSKVILLVVGEFKIKSDLPPECVSYNFKGKVQIDYFLCNTCAIKCKSFFFIDYFKILIQGFVRHARTIVIKVMN